MQRCSFPPRPVDTSARLARRSAFTSPRDAAAFRFHDDALSFSLSSDCLDAGDRSFKDGAIKVAPRGRETGPSRNGTRLLAAAREKRTTPTVRIDVFTFPVSTNSLREIFPRVCVLRPVSHSLSFAKKRSISRNRGQGGFAVDRSRREIPRGRRKKKLACRKRDLKACFFKDTVKIYARYYWPST